MAAMAAGGVGCGSPARGAPCAAERTASSSARSACTSAATVAAAVVDREASLVRGVGGVSLAFSRSSRSMVSSRTARRA